MAAVDLALRRSSRIAQHPHHPYAHTHVSPKRPHQIEQDSDNNDQLTPRALRALKRQRLTLDSDGLPLPQIESTKRRKENDNLTTGPLKEVRRRMRHVRIRTRPQNLSKPRHITPSQPILQPNILAPKDDVNKDAPLTPPPRSPSPIPHYRPPSPVPITPQSSPAIQSRSQSSSQPQSESPPSPNPTQSNPQPSTSLQLPMQVDLDSLIPLDPLPEFLPHNPPYTDSPSCGSVQVHDFPSGGDLNFSSNLNPFNTPQSSPFSSPDTFGSNHNAFPSNTGSFSNGFGVHSHEFIPAPSHSQPHPDFSSSQDNAFSSTTGFPSSPSGFPTPSSNGSFHLQSNDYTQSNGYTHSNGYNQQGAFSQPNHLSHTYEYSPPLPHRDREVNIWKLACQERVEFLLHRYGVDTIKALVASQARARHPSPSNPFSSTHASSTRFRLYTPASYIERASYTYKSAELDNVDFDMDDEDYDDDDDDDDECDFGCDGDDCDYDDEHDEDGLFPMNEEVLESGELKEGGEVKAVMVKSPDRDVSKTEISSSIPMPPIVPPTVPPIPQTTSMPSPSSSIPTLIQPPQIPESGSLPSISPSPSSLDVDSSPPAPIPQSSSQPICTPPTPTPGPPSPPSIPQTPSPPSTSPPSTPMPTTMPVSIHQPPQTSPTPTPPTPALPRTPPLSSLHVTLLSEPPRAFMGRGTPPDRRRLSEWGQWGCVTQIRAMGLCGDVQHSMVMRGDGQNVQLQLRHGEAQQQQHTSTSEHTSIPHGEHSSAQHGEAQQQHHEHGEHLPVQHAETHHDEHAHPLPHEPNHSEHLPTHGEWTSFLFAMLEGDPAGSSSAWYELGAGVSASSSVSGPGEPVSGSVVGMGSQGMNTLNVSALSVPQTVGEADSTLRFALG